MENRASRLRSRFVAKPKSSSESPRPRGRPRKNPINTAEERAEVFSRLVINAGNINRTAGETGVARRTIYEWLQKFRDEYLAVRQGVREEILSAVAKARKLAVEALSKALVVSAEMCDDKSVRDKVRPGDIARSLEILNRVLASGLSEYDTRGGDDAARPTSEADAEAQKELADAIADLAARPDDEEPVDDEGGKSSDD